MPKLGVHRPTGTVKDTVELRVENWTALRPFLAKVRVNVGCPYTTPPSDELQVFAIVVTHAEFALIIGGSAQKGDKYLGRPLTATADTGALQGLIEELYQRAPECEKQVVNGA